MAFHRDWENEPNPLIQWGLFTGVDRRYSDFGEMMKRTLEVGL
jgi:hypothetical protein